MDEYIVDLINKIKGKCDINYEKIIDSSNQKINGEYFIVEYFELNNIDLLKLSYFSEICEFVGYFEYKYLTSKSYEEFYWETNHRFLYFEYFPHHEEFFGSYDESYYFELISWSYNEIASKVNSIKEKKILNEIVKNVVVDESKKRGRL